MESSGEASFCVCKSDKGLLADLESYLICDSMKEIALNSLISGSLYIGTSIDLFKRVVCAKE